VNGSSTMMVEGARPLAMAAAQTKGLMLEPAWRFAWVAVLNFSVSKSRPPTSARTKPL